MWLKRWLTWVLALGLPALMALVFTGRRHFRH